MTPVGESHSELRTASDWQLHCEQQRGAAGSLTAPLLTSAEYGKLRQEFSRLTQRTRVLSQEGWLLTGICPTLDHWWRESLAFSRLLAQEFGHGPDACSVSLREILSVNSQFIAAIEQQARLCEFADIVAEHLHGFVGSILLGEQTSIPRLLGFAGELSQVLTIPDVRPALLPADSREISSFLTAMGWSHAGWVTQAVLTTRWLTQFSETVMQFDPECARILTAAGLLQDLGSWQFDFGKGTESESASDLGGQAHWFDPNHPGIGAAIIAGMPESPPLLPLLVGSHHERIDGTGWPQRLAGRRLSPESRWLSLLVRFAECVLTVDAPASNSSNCITPHQQSASLKSAAIRLWRDVRRGAFAERDAVTFLNAMHPHLAHEVAIWDQSQRRQLIDQQHSVPAPRAWKKRVESTSPFLESDHSRDPRGVEAPKYLVRRRSSGNRQTSLASPILRSTTPAGGEVLP